MQNRKIEIYTDGSCIGNPGPGGWAFILLHDGAEVAETGKTKDTTNNRMEMMAIIKALEYIRNKSGLTHEDLTSHKIILYSDSNLLMQSLNLGWKRKANLDLWAKIDLLRAWLDIEWTWVKAHATNKYNNKVDELAQSSARKPSRKV